MNATPEKKASLALRILRYVAAGVGAIALLIAVALIGAASPVGRGFIESTLDGMDLGETGVISAEGLEGNPLGHIRLARLSVSDADGVWLEVENAELRWRPAALLSRTIAVELARADVINVVRAPASSVEDNQSSDGGDMGDWRIALETLELPSIVLGAALFGEAAELAVNGGAQIRRSAADISLSVNRTDQPGDSLELDAQWRGLDLSGNLTLAARPGGPIANLAGMPDAALSAEAHADISDGAGQFTANAAIDETEVLNADFDLAVESVRGTARLRLADIAPLADIAARIGDEAVIELALVQETARRRALDARLAADGVTLNVSGALNARSHEPDGPLAIVLVVPDTDALAELPDDARIGAARFEGALTARRGLTLAGELDVADIATGDIAFERITGPIELTYDDDVVNADFSLTATSIDNGSVLAQALGPSPQVSAQARYETATGGLYVRAIRILTALGEATGEGEMSPQGDLRLELEADAPDLAAAIEGAAGAAHLQVSARRDADAEEAHFTVEALAENLSLPSPEANALLGPSPSLRFNAEYRDEEIVIGQARAAGEGFELMVEGVIGDEEDDVVTVSGAVSGASGLGGAALDGALALSAEARALLGEPMVRLQADATSIAFGDTVLNAPSLRAELTPQEGGARGPIVFEATSANGDIRASTIFGFSTDGVALEEISASGLGATVDGALSISPAGVVTGELAARAPAHGASADIALASRNGVQYAQGEARLNEMRLSDDVMLGATTLAFGGGLDGLSYTISTQAALPEPLTFNAEGELARAEDGALSITLSPVATLAEYRMTAAEPWTARLNDGAIEANAALALSSGATAALSLQHSDMTEIELSADDLPLLLISRLGLGPEINGAARLSAALSGRDVLTGTAELQITDLRSDAGGDASASAQLTANFTESGAAIGLRAQGGGFTARGDVEAPVTLAAWPPAPRVNGQAALSGRITADGDIEEMWRIIGPADQALAGALEVEVTLAGTPATPDVAGRGALSNGRFQDAASGIDLRDIDAAASFDGETARLDRLSASDGQGGVLAGEGSHNFPNGVSDIEIELTRLRVANRPDAAVTASGDISIERANRTIELNADLDIDQADLAPPNLGPPGVTVLAVEEVNRPATLAPPPAPPEPIDVDLNIHAEADRRVFFRSSGLDTEWSFDIDVTGESGDPRVSGEARLIRGSLEIGGERFTFDDAVIRLDGRPENARINLTARRERDDLTAIIRITGTAAQPRMSLESTPSYPEDEILARVLFGRSVSELSALEAAQLASALASLAGGGGGGIDVLGALRRGLGVDRLGVRTGGEAGPVVSGGTYLSDDVYLEVESSATGGAEAEIQWRLRPRLEIASRLGNGRDASISVRWRRDY